MRRSICVNLCRVQCKEDSLMMYSSPSPSSLPSALQSSRKKCPYSEDLYWNLQTVIFNIHTCIRMKLEEGKVRGTP